MANTLIDDIWHEQDKKMFDKLQSLINRMKRQIQEIDNIPLENLTDQQFKRREYLQDTIGILGYCWNRTNTYIEILGNERNWTIDKETELAQTKLELIRMKNNNALLLKLCTKLDGKRIIRPQPTVDNF